MSNVTMPHPKLRPVAVITRGDTRDYFDIDWNNEKVDFYKEERHELSAIPTERYAFCAKISEVEFADGRRGNAFPQYKRTPKGPVLAEIRCGGSSTGYPVVKFD